MMSLFSGVFVDVVFVDLKLPNMYNSFTGEKCLIGRGLPGCHVTSIPQIKHGCNWVFIRSPSTKKPFFRPVKRTNVWLHSAFLCQRDSVLSHQCYEGNFFKNCKVNASLGCCGSVRVEIRLWSLPANGLSSWFQLMRLSFKKWNKKDTTKFPNGFSSN